MKIILCDSKLNKSQIDFIEYWHYSKSARSLMQKYVFELRDNNNLIGIAIYGKPIGRNCRQLYGNVIELRRLCLIDEAPKNSESFFLGRTLKWLEKNTNYEGVLTYSDPFYGHKGTIYKATNFSYIGKQKTPNPRVVKFGKKMIHLRQMYQKRKGEYTNNALKIQNLVKNKKAKVLKMPKKDSWMYFLDKKDRKFNSIY
tara:strand:+ start:866 stop:1462 length:597 start_codon:yes stop_codon:yes gene_type:complete